MSLDGPACELVTPGATFNWKERLNHAAFGLRQRRRSRQLAPLNTDGYCTDCPGGGCESGCDAVMAPIGKATASSTSTSTGSNTGSFTGTGSSTSHVNGHQHRHRRFFCLASSSTASASGPN